MNENETLELLFDIRESVGVIFSVVNDPSEQNLEKALEASEKLPDLLRKFVEAKYAQTMRR